MTSRKGFSVDRNELGTEPVRRLALSRLTLGPTKASCLDEELETWQRELTAADAGILEDVSNVCLGGRLCAVRQPKIVIEPQDIGSYYFRQCFAGRAHIDYFGTDEQLGPIAVSLVKESSDRKEGVRIISHTLYRLIIRIRNLFTMRMAVSETDPRTVPPYPHSRTPRTLSSNPFRRPPTSHPPPKSRNSSSRSMNSQSTPDTRSASCTAATISPPRNRCTTTKQVVRRLRNPWTFDRRLSVLLMNDLHWFKIRDVAADQQLLLNEAEIVFHSFVGENRIRFDDGTVLRAEEVVFHKDGVVECEVVSTRIALAEVADQDRRDDPNISNIPDQPDDTYHFVVEAGEDVENRNPNTAAMDENAKTADALKKPLEQSATSLGAALAKAKIAELESAAAPKAQIQKLQAELAYPKQTPAISEAVKEKVAELPKRVDAAEAARAANGQRSVQSSAELETLTTKLDALQTGFIEKENLTQANNSFAEERKQHLAEIEDLKNQNTNKDGAITKLNHELRKAYNDSREHLAEVEEVKKALATSKEAELFLTARCDALAKKLADHDKYAQDSKSTIYELQNEIKSMEREKNDIKQQLREERERVKQFEKVETVAPVHSAPPAEDSATKEQIEKLEKELEAAQKKNAELEAAQKESSAQTPAIEQEVVQLKAKKNELAETNVKLAAAVRDAEAMAKQIEADATAANATTLKLVVDTLGEALSSAGVKINPNVPSSVDGLQKWIQTVAGAVKKATAKPKEVTPAPEAAKPTTSSADSEEVEQLKETVADYEDRLANVAKHIEAIEGAYHEYKHDQEKKLAALQARN